MIRSISRAAVLALFTLLLISPAHSQSIFGEIRGTVSDATGAVVPEATVTARNTGTSESRKVQSDASGNYSFVNLEAGTYEVRIEKSGFRASLIQNVVLRAREVARADAALALAQTTTEVLVVESRQVITTDMATIVDSKSANEVQNLPVNFRGAGGTNSVFSAISLAPGVQTDAGGGSLSIGGNMPFMATSSVDGISNINVRSNGILTEMFPSADAVDEIKVSSTSNNAEFAQAGDITTTSKAGTNDYHGSLFWYHQNGAFDARDFFSTRQGAPFKISNDFGFSAGGPVQIPRVYNGKNRTFFYGVYEALRFKTQNIINVIVPPDPFRRGDLSSFSAAVRDPLAAGQTFPGNIIPASRISSVAAGLLTALYPLPTQAGTSIAAPNYRVQRPVTNRNDQFDVRGDHLFNEKHSVFARFSYKDVTRLSGDALPAFGDNRNPQTSRTLVAAYTWVIKSNLFNEFRFGYSNRPIFGDFGAGGKSFDGPGLLRSLGVQGINPAPPSGASVPDIGINGYYGTGKGRGFTTLSSTYQFTDNLSWVKGKHTYKFGTDIRRLRTTDITSFFSGDDMGEYRFNGMWSGNAFGDFLLGYPQRTRVANTGQDVNGVTYHYGFFAQDDYKITRRLTLNYGVRYELHPMFFDNALTTSNFDRAFPGPGARVVIANEQARRFTAPAFIASIGNTPIVTAKEAGLPETLRYNDYNNFAPRIGFAFRANDRTVIRGGYGIYTATILGSVFYTITGIHVSDVRTFANTAAGGVPQLNLTRPFGAAGGAAAVGSADFRRGTQFDGADPYTQQWNLTIERDLGWKTGLRVTYTGSRSVKLFSSPDLNQVRANTLGYSAVRPNRPYPNWNIVYVRDPNVGHWYNGLTTEVIKRLSNGLYFQTSWVWAKNLSNATGSNGSGFASENGSVPTDRYNLKYDYGNVAPTRRHRWLTTFTYDLPFAKGLTANSAGAKFGKALVAGWQLSGIVILQTGPFLTPITGGVTDPSGTNVDQRASDRPDYTGTSYGNDPANRTIDTFWNRSAFSVPASNIGRYGYAAAGSLIGPGTQNFSAKMQKKFFVKERAYIQVEGSFSNLFNHPNFAAPAQNVSVPSFGRITSTQGAEQGGSRTIQVGLRFAF